MTTKPTLPNPNEPIGGGVSLWLGLLMLAPFVAVLLVLIYMAVTGQ